jgi:hypothetical protein
MAQIFPFRGYWHSPAGVVMKKRLLHGFGMAFLLASPIWITMQDPANYLNFGISLILGILLLLLAWQTNLAS